MSFRDAALAKMVMMVGIPCATMNVKIILYEFGCTMDTINVHIKADYFVA
jgi:hypothetical protein